VIAGVLGVAMAKANLSRAVLYALACGTLVAVIAGQRASTASAYIYYAEYSTNAIGRAANDGSHNEPAFIAGASGPAGMASDGEHLYWANSGNGTIGRANLDGTGVNEAFISGLKQPRDVAVNNAYIFWADTVGEDIGGRVS
jgi:hypothetical protein